MRTAVLTVPTGTSGLRFEVHSTPSRGHSSIQKWYLKANHPVEASRWISALQKSMELAKRESEQHDRRSGESQAPSLKPSLSISSTHPPSRRKDRSGASSAVDAESGGEASDRKEASDPLNDHDQEEQESEDTSDADSTQRVPPHSNSFELQGNALLAQVELTSQLLSSLPSQIPGTPRAVEANKVIDDTFHSVSGMLTEYVSMAKEREDWYKSKLERQNIWEESLQAVVREGDMLEKELRSKFRRSRAPSFTQEGTVRKRSTQLVSSPVADTVTTATPASPTATQPESPSVPSSIGPIAQRRTSAPSSGLPLSHSSSRPFSLIMGGASNAGLALDDDGDTDEEDEFFDAIEANTLPNLLITQSFIRPNSVQFNLSREVYAGYLKLRDRLSILV